MGGAGETKTGVDAASRCIPRRCGIVLLALALLLAGPASALPPGFVQTELGSGWGDVAGLHFSKDGSRLYVIERGGRVYIVDPATGVKDPTPFMDISAEVGGWRDFGLLGFVLHPNFEANGYVYVLHVMDRYYLDNFGQPGYDPGQLESMQFRATIGRISRFTADPATSLRTILPGSQLILVGATPDDGIPILHQSHGTGQLVFGEDGSLMATNGDGASYSSTDLGSASETYWAEGLSTGIIEPWENIGAHRSQMIDSYNGNVLRIDPMTGEGLPSNPWYDPSNPSSVRSRSFAVGLRNPYRFSMRPGTGSPDAALADPGVFYIGDVGWGSSEDLQILKAPAQNFGWPNFEGQVTQSGYWNANTYHPFAKNPLFGVGGCTQEYFHFRNLIVQETLNPPSWPNPCNGSVPIPDSWVDPGDSTVYTYHKFMHSRPPISWRGGSRVATFDGGGNATYIAVGAPGSPVTGNDFSGNASTGGVWYTGTDFPVAWQNTYFHADYGAGWIKSFGFDENDQPFDVVDFVDPDENVTFVATSPANGGIYYVKWASNVREIRYAGLANGSTPPNAVASITSPAVNYGDSPFEVEFRGADSSDIDPGDSITYSWSFGNGDTSSQANPTYTFDTSPDSDPAFFFVTLTVTDENSNVDDASLLISVNNEPPAASVTSPIDGTLFDMSGPTLVDLTGTATDPDPEHGPGQLGCTWTIEHVHNDHTHAQPPIETCSPTQATITPVGCDESVHAWRFTLTVTDGAFLSHSDSALMYPDCSTLPNTPPVALPDFAAVAQGYAVDIDVLANDADADGTIDPTTVVVQAPPQWGSYSVDPVTGVITYTKDTSSNLEDQLTYTVDDDDGDPSNVATVFISAFNNPPTAQITSPAHGSEYVDGQHLLLAAQGSDPEDGSAVSYDWQIDALVDDQLVPGVFSWSGETPPLFETGSDGQPASAVSYLVQVTVTDIAGATASHTARVGPASPPGGNGAPTAAFSATPAIGVVPLSVDFDAAASTDPEGDYLSFEWDFGDGSSATGATATHDYPATGSYAARLTAIDSAGNSDVAALLVQATESGLQGTYINNWSENGQGYLDMSNPALVRVDPNIAFAWGSGSPDPALANDNFAARWEGQINPLYSEDYQFFTYTDDGVRLWVDGVLVVDHWSPQGPTERTGPTISLQAGLWYDIVMEFFENGGGAVAELRWESPSQTKQVVPTQRLAPASASNPGPAAVDDTAAVSASGAVLVDVLANDLDEKDEIDPTSVLVTSGPSHGSTGVNGVTGVVTYTHGGAAVASDSFTYTVQDLDGATSNAATVSIAIDLGAPSVSIVSPSPGLAIPGRQVDLVYTVGADPASYDHIHLALDQPPVVEEASADGSHSFQDVDPGSHTVLVQLVDASHQPLGTPLAQASVIFSTIPEAVCGDGVAEQDELCDDGNLIDGDCCSSSCTPEPSGSACDDDLNGCTQDVCDGAGLCTHPDEANGLGCDDVDACTATDVCAAGVCVGTPLPDSDGDLVCDLLDDDDDDDGVLDGADADPFDPFVCGDVDVDGCEDCSSGVFDLLNDGPDFDADGLCESELSIGASRDNTLYQDVAGALSNGAGDHLFAGTTAVGQIRRGLLSFDVAAVLPPGSVVHDVTLTLEMSRSIANTESVSLHAMLSDWGEQLSDAPGQEGGGAPAEIGEATWLHDFATGSMWTTAGGDFNAVASATQLVGPQLGPYSWADSLLVADVQQWVDDPGSSFGWMLIGDELASSTAQRFDTRENAGSPNQPTLWIHYSPGPGQSGGCCYASGACGLSVSGAACTGNGGVYQGDATSCSPNPCPVATGACCMPEGTCSVLTQTTCEAAGGGYSGDATSCSADLCAITYLEPFVDPLPVPAVAQPVTGASGAAADYQIGMTEFSQQLHRDLPDTTVWGYGGSYPGPTIEAAVGERVTVDWINDLRDDQGTLRTEHYLPVDLCPHGPAQHGNTPRTVVHLHGAHTKQEWDGYPEDTILPGESDLYEYPNHQLPATLWYHDHGLGITRLNVYMGLAGFYLIRDAFEASLGLPAGEYEIPLVIQDRSFDADGSFRYPALWQPTYYADHNLVNGMVSPYLDVKQGKYRFRLLNGANSRPYTLTLSGGLDFELIGTDGGLLPGPVTMSEITLTGAERADVIVDFSALAPGTEIVMTNTSPAPETAPPGTNATPNVMKFVVQNAVGFTAPIPPSLRPMIGHDEQDAVEIRDFELAKFPDACTGETWLINGLKWNDIVEYPELGSTEVWRFVNNSGMVHPMHMHLVMFQVLDRQAFDLIDGEVVPIGSPTPPAPHESGWKDTVPVHPNEIVRVIARFEDYTGKFAYHCHILEHEDQEMMRQFEVVDFCGNGVVGPEEECDDGNTVGGDCCSLDCTVEPSGWVCNPDVDICSTYACDGAGACVQTAAEPDGTACLDTDTCTIDSTCNAGVCQGGSQGPDLDQDSICDAADEDADGDYLLDEMEPGLGLDPFDPDSDGDGVGDAEEISVGMDPTNAAETPASPLPHQVGIVTGVSNAGWTSVGLDASYADMVVLATPVYDASHPPLVTRIRNAAGSAFEVRVDRVDGVSGALGGVDVHYLVVESGVYTEAVHGITMEAVSFSSSVTDGAGSWVGEARAYQQAYTQPVVLGQVMTYNDAAVSSFWSRGVDRFSLPSASELHVGKHVGEDPQTTRLDETLGYLVIEAGAGAIGWTPFVAGVSAVDVPGIELPAGAGIPLSLSVARLDAALVSQTAVQGNSGGWGLLRAPVSDTASALSPAIDEDQLFDAERGETLEAVAYLAFASTPLGGFLFEFGDAPATPPAASATGGELLMAVMGTFSGPDDVDLYQLQISEPTEFAAIALGPADETLFLFQQGGEGIAANADDGGSLDRPVFSTGDPLVSVLAPGLYVLGIAQHGVVPSTGGSPIFPADLSGAAHGPDDPGPVDAWASAPGGGSAGYAISISGGDFPVIFVPEPGGLVLLMAGGLGLTGLSRLRARRARRAASGRD